MFGCSSGFNDSHFFAHHLGIPTLGTRLSQRIADTMGDIDRLAPVTVVSPDYAGSLLDWAEAQRARFAGA